MPKHSLTHPYKQMHALYISYVHVTPVQAHTYTTQHDTLYTTHAHTYAQARASTYAQAHNTMFHSQILG